jgi:hypothetical protein
MVRSQAGRIGPVAHTAARALGTVATSKLTTTRPVAATVRGGVDDPVLAIALFAAVSVRVFFWAYTDRRYDDALITITHSANAAAGLGLTHHPGEGHVQGFTSAVSALIPLAGEFMHAGWGFTAMRLASLAAAVVTVWIANRLASQLGLGTWSRVLLLGYLAVDYLQIFFGMAGMETQLAVAGVIAGIWLIETERLTAAGVCLGLAVLVRPDFVLFSAPGIVLLAARARSRMRAVALAAGAGLAVAVPWLAFASAYYGSPVPHTIAAKSQAYTSAPGLAEGPGVWAYFLWDNVQKQFHDAWKPLSPFNENVAMAAPGWKLVAIVVGLLMLAGLFTRRRDRALDLPVAFAFLFVSYLVVFSPPTYFRWYLPPLLAVIVLFAACGLDAIERRIPLVAMALAMAVVGAYAVQIPVMFPLDRTVQQKIENGVREPLGRYLGAVVPPGESVVSESAGYVGYYGHVKLYDFPGLTSPTARRALGTVPQEMRSLYQLIRLTRPDWIVLRPSELAILRSRWLEVFRQYEVVRRFAVRREDSRLESWGLGMNNVDRDFRVLRRISRAAQRGVHRRLMPAYRRPAPASEARTRRAPGVGRS